MAPNYDINWMIENWIRGLNSVHCRGIRDRCPWWCKPASHIHADEVINRKFLPLNKKASISKNRGKKVFATFMLSGPFTPSRNVIYTPMISIKISVSFIQFRQIVGLECISLCPTSISNACYMVYSTNGVLNFINIYFARYKFYLRVA